MSNKITRLVFSGGGAKGAVYPGAYAALKETGVFDGVKEVAGSSAGAFTAALMAVGMSTKEFQNDLMNMNFGKLLGNPHNGSWITKDGHPIYDYLRTTIKTQVLTFLKKQDLKESHPCWQLLDNLENNNHSPTFADLGQLIQSWPDRFKRLTITAVKQQGGDLKIFNQDDTPDVEIALACKASGAIPIVFKPVEITIDGNSEKYVDGAMQENIPTEYFDKDEQTNQYLPNQFRENTLVFSFLEGNIHTEHTQTNRFWTLIMGGNSVFSLLHGSRKDEYENLEFFNKLLAQVEIELNKLISPNTDKNLIEKLIDQAVDAISFNDDGSWLSYLWAVIVSFFVSVWTFIVNAFSNSNLQAHELLDASTKEQTDRPVYFNIIREQLKKFASDHDITNREPDYYAKVLCQQVADEMADKAHHIGPNKPPTLYNKNFIERCAYNYIPKLFSNYSSDSIITVTTEESFQRLRKHYPLRTVGLGIGNLSAVDFDKATTHSRFMCARGYLDTINTISNLYLYDKKFDAYDFYFNVVHYFAELFNKVLITANIDPNTDRLLIKLNNEPSIQSKFHLIKEAAEADWNSHQAFALTRAVEFIKDDRSKEEIWIDIDERCGVKYSDNSHLLFNNSASTHSDAVEITKKLGTPPVGELYFT